MTLRLSYGLVVELIEKLISSDLFFEYEYSKHRLVISEDVKASPIFVRLPIHFKYPESLKNGTTRPVSHITLLIKAGKSAIGYSQGEHLIDHKVISTYMVRKKQGKSQIKYLKTKGKSRAGSRIRLANSVRFFEHINERLTQHFNRYRIDRISMSCSKTLLPFLFQAKAGCPFNKKDERIYSIPRHIHQPDFKILKDTLQFLLRGDIHYEPSHQKLINKLM